MANYDENMGYDPRKNTQDKVDALQDKMAVLDTPFSRAAAKEAALKNSARAPSKVTALNVKPEPTVVDEIVETLEGLLEAIKSGDIEPSHLIVGYGERVALTDGGKKDASSYLWDAVGLDVFQVIGHLNSYAFRLAIGDGE